MYVSVLKVYFVGFFSLQGEDILAICMRAPEGFKWVHARLCVSVSVCVHMCVSAG